MTAPVVSSSQLTLNSTPGSAMLLDRIDALRRVVELGEGRLEASLLDQAVAVLSRADQRMRLSLDHTVVAIAGATGSGKSTLFNALVGRELAEAGVRRPTTARTSAAVWGPLESAAALLEWLDVGARHVIDPTEPRADSRPRTSDLTGLVLLDLPDHDSLALSHRLEVDRLLELADVFVWVVDPQKYADALLHHEYLHRMAGHDAVTVVVLNHIDTLDAQRARQCLTDATRLVRDDGLETATVLGISARTGAGLPALEAHLQQAVHHKHATVARLDADVRAVAGRITEASGIAEAAHQGSGKPPRIGRKDRAQLVEALTRAAQVDTVADAAARSYRRGLITATGWPLTRWLTRLRPDPLNRLHLGRKKVSRWSSAEDETTGAVAARTSLPSLSPVTASRVNEALRQLTTTVGEGMPEWQRQALRVRSGLNDAGVATQESGQLSRGLADALDQAVATAGVGELRRPLWWRFAGLLQWLATLAFVVGMLWLAAIFVVQWFQLPKPPTWRWFGLEAPTVLALGGLLASLLIALAGRWLGRFGAKRRHRKVRALLAKHVAGVAETQVLTPVHDEMERYRSLCDQLERARR